MNDGVRVNDNGSAPAGEAAAPYTADVAARRRERGAPRAVPRVEGAVEGSGMAVTRIAIERPLLMLMAISAVLIFGVIGYRRMGVDLFPAVNFPFVMVSVGYPGTSPEVIENLVTKPIEDAVAGLADLKTLNSFSSEGQSTVTLEFSDRADPQTVAIEVEKRINAARPNLPADILPPAVAKFDFTQQPIMQLALSGDRSPEQLFRLADERIRPRLESVNGVGQVTVVGGRQREIQVKIDPSRLRAYNLTLQQVTQALGAENVNLPGGQVHDPTRNVNLRIDAKFRTLAEIEDTVVAALPTGGAVRVRDLGIIVDGFKQQTLIGRVNGKDAVGITISKSSSANVTSTAAGVRAELKRLQATLPEGAHVEVLQDSSEFITNSLNGVQRSLLEAVALTGLVLLVFLHSWRSTAIVVLAIPTSLIATFGTMWLQGFTLNFLTTLGLALTVGILVDDSIVVLENIYRHLNRGEAPRLAAIRGRSEIGMAAIAITLVDVVVFAPVGLLTGQIGQFFRQFGFTVVAATLFSLIVSFTLTPMLASRWLRAEDDHGRGWLAAFGRRWEQWFAALERRYTAALRWTLGHRWWVVAGAVAAFVTGVALPAAGIVKTEFFPQQDEGVFSLFVEMPPGTNLATTERAAAQVESRLLAVPEVETVFTSVGLGDQSDLQSRFAVLSVNLVERRSRSRTAEQVSREAKTFGQGVPGAKVRPGTPGAGGFTSQPIQIKIFGDDLATLNSLADQATAALAALGTVTDITNSGRAGAPEYVISIDRQKAADLGLSAAQVASTVRTAYAGTVATQLRRDNVVGTAAGIDVRVHLTDETRDNLDRLNAVPLVSPSKGGQVLLGQIASVTPAQGPSQIQRTDRQRIITLGANLAEGQILGDVSRQVDGALKQLEWPSAYRYRLGGETEDQNATFTEFGGALMLSIVLVYMLLVALYESLLYPLVVIFALPLALVGAMAGLAISRETLNLFSLIGVILLTGLVGKNSILVVDYTNRLRREGMSRREALLHAGPARLRPILMTSAALIMAQVPLVLKLEEGSEIQAPLAVVVMGGMMTSTLLALIFVPAMYTIVDDLQNLILRLFRVRRPTPDKPDTMDREDGNVNGDVAPKDVDETQELPARPRPRAPAGAVTGAVATLLVAGGLLLSACGSADTAKAAPAPPPLSVAVAEVKTDTIRAAYNASGTVEAADQVAIVPKVGGRLTRLNAEVGQRVEAGQLLAEVDHAATDIQVAQAEAALAAAQARLAQLERGARPEEVAMAAAQRDAAVQQAQAAGAQATAAAQGVATLDAQAQAAQQQAAAAAAQAAAARTRVEQVQHPRAEDLAFLESQVRLAQIRLAQAQSQDEAVQIAAAQAEVARVALQQAQEGSRPEQVRAAQAALDQAETALAQLTTQPVRAEDVNVARLTVEAATAALESAQEAFTQAVKARNAARNQSDHLPFGMTRAQADMALAQAETGVITAQATYDQRRVQRDQAQATYDKLAAGATAWDVRLAQERVEAAKAQLDLTKNPDPARVRTAQLQVEQAQLQLAARRKQIGFEAQQPSAYDVQALDEQARAAEAQAEAALAQVEVLASQRAAAEVSAQGTGSQAAAAAANVRQAEAALALRRSPYTAEDVRAARAAVQQAQANVDAIKLQQADAVIYAPVSGVVATRAASTGALVGPQAPIATLVSDAVEVAVPVEEARLAGIKPGQPVTLAAAAYPGEALGGTVVAVAPAGDPRSRAFTARIRPDDAAAGRLRPGMSVQVSIATEERAAVPVVPRDALLQKEGKAAVFVVGPDNTVTLRPVRLGLMADRLAEIAEGLAPGEQVVVVGADDLRDGQRVAPVPAR